MLQRVTLGKKRSERGAVVSLMVVMGREVRYPVRLYTKRPRAATVTSRMMRVQNILEISPG